MTGKTVLITRSKADGETLTDALHERGFRVIHEALTDVVLNHTARPELEAALIADPDAVIVTSRYGIRALAALSELRDLPILCVGEETQRAAESAGFIRVTLGGNNVTALVEHVMAAYEEGSHFLYPSAEHIRIDLAEALALMHIERIVVYEAQASERFSDILLEQLKRGQIDIVTFFSQRSARIFTSLLGEAELPDTAKTLHACCLSAAVAEPLTRNGWAEIHVASEPTLASLVNCVDNAGE